MDYEEKIKDKLGKNLKPCKSSFINNLTGSKNNEAPLQFLFEVQAKYVDVYVKWNTTLAYKILTQMDCLTLNYKA